MSRVAEALLGMTSWSFSFFESQKQREKVRKDTWGTREYLENMGEKIKDMSWHEKPKRIFSPKTQMDLYFGWLRSITDRRTRRIIAASLMDYYVPVDDEEYQQIKDKKEIRFKTVYTLDFNSFSIPPDHPWYFPTMLETEPFIAYQEWVVNGDDAKREFVKKYGEITEIKIPMVKRSTMIHRFYTLSRAMKYITDYKGKKDSYFNTSMTYQKPSKKDYRRLGERVTEYCLLFSEIDYYKKNSYKDQTKKEMLKLIYNELDEHDFPRPTEVIYTRGLHLVWKISPIPAFRFYEWEMMQKKIHSILEKFGSDTQTVTDKVRLLRLAGTIHSNTGERIWGHSFTDNRYLFNELMDKFCAEELEIEKKKREKKRKKYLDKLETRFEVIDGGSRILKQERKDNPLQNSNYVGNLIHEKYRRDLLHLINLRNGSMEGYRELCCFLVRYWTLCITNGQTVKAIHEMENVFYSMNINGEYTLQEIISYTKSAETAYAKWKKNWREGYNYRNDTLVRFLDVTKEEQKSMWILMDDQEAKRRQQKRDTNKKRIKRGSVSNEELDAVVTDSIIKNPMLGAEKLAAMIRKRLGKCSKSKVLQVKKRLKEKGLI